MKIPNSILLLASGILLAFVFAFKSNTSEPVKEYVSINNFGSGVDVIFPDKTVKRTNYYDSDNAKEINKILNELSSEGWVLVAGSGGAGSVNKNIYSLYMERAKR